MRAKSVSIAIVLMTIAAGMLFAIPSSPTASTKPIVTFIELGSVNCIPCKAMQPVMESIRKKYPDQVSVLFYDVWTKDGAQYGQRFRIRVIPTQVFLDKNGKEYFRHEGFFPEEELVKILAKGGVKP
ncbi:MAG: thioredoxin family protein [Spirochaetaceae bacterium]|nr:thioredoxin family protein [Spirochaetaceae bacterium]